MAVKSSIRPLLRRIVDVIAGYVDDQGSHREDFAILGAWNERAERIRLVLLATNPRLSGDFQRWYGEILDRFRRDLDEPGLPPVSWNIGLVLSWSANRDEAIGNFVVTDEEEDVTEILAAEWDARQPPSSSSLTRHGST